MARRFTNPIAGAGPPPGVRAMLRGRRRRTLLAARGRVADLGGELADLDAYPKDLNGPVTVLDGDARDVVTGLADGAPFDTVVSLGRLATFGDEADDVVAAIGEALAPSGRLVFLEPDPGAGPVGRGATRLWSLAGVDVTPGITGRLWNGGMSVLRVRRFSVPTLAVPLRNWVWGTARTVRHEETT